MTMDLDAMVATFTFPGAYLPPYAVAVGQAPVKAVLQTAVAVPVGKHRQFDFGRASVTR